MRGNALNSTQISIHGWIDGKKYHGNILSLISLPKNKPARPSKPMVGRHPRLFLWKMLPFFEGPSFVKFLGRWKSAVEIKSPGKHQLPPKAPQLPCAIQVPNILIFQILKKNGWKTVRHSGFPRWTWHVFPWNPGWFITGSLHWRILIPIWFGGIIPNIQQITRVLVTAHMSSSCSTTRWAPSSCK